MTSVGFIASVASKIDLAEVGGRREGVVQGGVLLYLRFRPASLRWCMSLMQSFFR